MKIGLCGITFKSANYGVTALAYSQLSLFNNCVKELSIKDVVYYLFSAHDNEPVVRTIAKNIGVDGQIYVMDSARYRTGLAGLNNLVHKMSECDIVFDLTLGDSFSDIYGYRRFILQAIEKTVAIRKSKLIICPQTIGPFYKPWGLRFGQYALKNAVAVYARDTYSADYAQTICPNLQVITTSDLAFALPYTQAEKLNADGMIHVGISVSALLWYGGYTGKNEFGLKCDYQLYTRRIIRHLLNNGCYKVHMIAHVYTNDIGDDYAVCELLKSEFSDIVLSPHFADPIEAKSYFSGLDILIGARMHATIGAISSGAVCLPFSYSRKFEGLYDSIQYPYVIKAKEWDTEECFSSTIKYIEDFENIIPIARNAVKLAKEKNELYYQGIREVLLNIKNKKS